MDAPDRRLIVLVTGAGRSGTSTVAGALNLLGLHIPEPVVEADQTNPHGFFESQWVVDFHKALINSVPVRTVDARPEAAALAAKAAGDPAAYEELRAWLVQQMDHPRLVIKDPRAFWLTDLWHRVADELGYDLAFLTMLRHPVEVAMSRDVAYLAEEKEQFRRRRTTANIAAWCNAAFDTERATRDSPRAMVRHTDLLADWRTALTRAAGQIGLSLDTDLTTAEHHPVDDFIDTSLRRAEVTWAALEVPSELRELAERTWTAMNLLVEQPRDRAASDELAQLRAHYAALHDDAVALALDHTKAREAHVRRTVKANLARRRLSD